MTLDVSCPKCQAHFRVPKDLAGKSGRCGKCGAKIKVPGNELAAAESDIDSLVSGWQPPVVVNSTPDEENEPTPEEFSRALVPADPPVINVRSRRPRRTIDSVKKIGVLLFAVAGVMLVAKVTYNMSPDIRAIERENKRGEQLNDELFSIHERRFEERMSSIRSGEEVEEQLSSEPELIIDAFRWGREYGFINGAGEVTNNTDRRLEAVTAVVTFYTADDDFVKSSEAMISYDPLLPGQTSPFQIIETDNPAIKQARISFKRFLGGTLSAVRRKDLSDETKSP